MNKQHHENVAINQDRDNIFVIQELLEKWKSGDNEEYLVRFENYEKPVWEPKSSIMPFILTYYEKTGNSKIPPARIKHTKTVGKAFYNLKSVAKNGWVIPI